MRKVGFQDVFQLFLFGFQAVFGFQEACSVFRKPFSCNFQDTENLCGFQDACSVFRILCSDFRMHVRISGRLFGFQDACSDACADSIGRFSRLTMNE